MKRSLLLASFRTAGYHDDRREFTRLKVEHRIAFAAAQRAWAEGERLRAGGFRCGCGPCGAHQEAAAP